MARATLARSRRMDSLFQSKVIRFHFNMILFQSKLILFQSKMIWFQSKMIWFQSKMIWFLSSEICSTTDHICLFNLGGDMVLSCRTRTCLFESYNHSLKVMTYLIFLLNK
jgi:hypothetical protein